MPSHRQRAPRAVRSRRPIRAAIASLLTGAMVAGLGLLIAPMAASAATSAPMEALHGFTVLTEGDLVTAESAHEIEGSAAVGGDVIVGKSYILGTAHGGSALPSIAGEPVQLLVGGTLDIRVSGEALKTNQGKARIGVTTGFGVNDGGSTPKATGKRLFNTATPDNVLFMANDSTSVAAVTAPGLWSSTFAGAFAQLRADSVAIAALGSPEATVIELVQPTNFNGVSQSDRGLQLVANTINVLRVSESQLENGFQNLKFLGSVTPSATSPLVIDITDAGAVDLTLPVIVNAKASAPWILWNASGATTLTLRGSQGSGYIEGSILAPNADVTFASGYIEGQVAARSFRVTSGGEIHHIASQFRLPSTETASGSWSTADPACAPGPVGGSLTVDSVPGIVYTWTAPPAGRSPGDTFTSWSGSNLPAGTLAFTVAGTGGVTAIGTLAFSRAFPAPPVSCTTAEVPTAPTAVDACGTAGDDYTVPADGEHFVWSVTDARELGVGTVTIAAIPTGGWSFPGTTQSSWTFAFTDTACPPQVVPISAVPTATDACGVADDTLTIPTPGAGDHYAFSTSGPSGVPGSAAGTVTVTATPEAGSSFGDAQSSWEFVFTDVACAPEIVSIAAAPSATDACGLVDDALTIPAPGDHYAFTRTGPSGAPGSTVGTVIVTAVPEAGYSFGDAQSSWEFVFTDAACPPQLETVSAPPTAVDVCGVADDALHIPTPGADDHYTFLRTGPDGVPGAAHGTVVVEAVADEGWTLGTAQTRWEFEFTDVACPPVNRPTPPLPPDFDDACGVADDAVHLPEVDADAVRYTVDDRRDADGVGRVTVTAEPGEGLAFPEGAEREWSHDFTAEDCTLTPVLQTDPEASSCSNRGQSAFPAWIRILPTEHVDYRIDGVLTTTEYTRVDAGDHTVTATAHDGYILGAANPDPDEWTDTEHTWFFTAADTTLCPTPISPPVTWSANATANDQVCIDGRVTGAWISVSWPTSDPTAVRYRLADGTELVSGTTIVPPGAYVVTATTRDADAEIVGASSWTLEISAASADCGHETPSSLQRTGSGPVAPIALVALALGMAGLALLGLSLLAPREGVRRRA